MKNEEKANSTANSTGGKPRRAVLGLFVRKECWRLSWRGVLLLLFLLVSSALVLQRAIYPFLAVTNRQPGAEYLIVEGWMTAPNLREAYAEFQAGHYRKIYTSGCPMPDEWDPKATVTYADWAAAKFKRLGVPENLVQPIPSYVQQRDRTYSSAVAVRKWFERNHISIRALNVATVGPHARRTWLLYQKAFGPQVHISVIALDKVEFDPAHWWRSSEGVREVIGETLAYIYARFIFSPPAGDKP